MEVTINGHVHQLKFGYKATKLVADKWGLDKPSEVEKELSNVLQAGEDASFSQMEKLGDFFLAGIQATNPGVDLTAADIMEAITDDSTIMQAFLNEYTKTLPKQTEGLGVEKKTKPTKKA